MNGNTASKDTVKVLLLGDEGCGKTTLLKTYTGSNVNEVRCALLTLETQLVNQAGTLFAIMRYVLRPIFEL